MLPASVAAQWCRGVPSLGASVANLGVGASYFDGGKGFGAEVQVGGQLFFEGSFNYVDIDDSSFSLKTIGAGVGYELAVAEERVSVCPGVGIDYGFGLEVLGIDFTALQLAPSVAVGLPTEVSSTLTVTPFADAAFVYTRLNVDAGPFFDETESETSGLIGLGLGFRFNDVLTVRPAVTFPVSEPDGNTLFSVLVSVPLGG